MLGTILALIISFEGFSSTAYWDNGWAIGYGHHGPEVTKNLVYTKEEAYEVLKHDVGFVFDCLRRNSNNCSGNCRIAISDFIHNMGCGSYSKSRLRKLISQGRWEDASLEIQKWVYSKGRKLRGLVKRRAVEADYLRAMPSQLP